MQRKDIKARTILAYNRFNNPISYPAMVIDTTLYRNKLLADSEGTGVEQCFQPSDRTRYVAPGPMGMGRTGYLTLFSFSLKEDDQERLRDRIKRLPENFTNQELNQFISDLPEDFKVRLVNNKHLLGPYDIIRAKEIKERDEARAQDEKRSKIKEAQNAKARLVADRLEALGYGPHHRSASLAGEMSVHVDVLADILGL